MNFVLVQRLGDSLRARAASLLGSIEDGLDNIMLGWLLVAGLACAARIAFTLPGAPEIETVAPYILLILAPFASMVLALRWFADGDSHPQPDIRLARMGRWRSVGREEARRHRLYGAGGLMVSLLVGILLNVPARAAEFLAAMPAIGGQVPSWLATLHMLMTVDVVVLSSLYTIAFVAALRRVPLFPRLLVAIWGLDLTMQLVIAELIGRASDLPPDVAGALYPVLDGNSKKVLVSIALWLPYLLLSKRVNLTYRGRLPG